MLCNACNDAIQSLWHLENGSVPHHPSYSSLATSIEEGCFICRDIEYLIVGDDTKSAVEDAVTVHGSLTNLRVISSPVDRVGRLYLVNSKPIITACGLPQGPSEDDTRILTYSLTPLAATDIPLDTKSHVSSSTLSDSTGSKQTLTMIKNWLETCISTHDACNTGRTDGWIPSRLLEVSGNGEDLKLHLRSHFQDDKLQYLTLSHRWGAESSQQPKLSADTSEVFRNGVAVVGLPKTFRDMVEITWRLGFRYLWIDCMCIYQDDEDDWRKESALMGKVYANSWLNIAATAANDSSQGCFRTRDLSRMVHHLIGPSHDSAGTTSWVLTPWDMWSHAIEQATLNKRGWVLQERILSPRVVHFAEQQVFWDCREFRACESFSRGALPDAKSPNDYSAVKQLVPGRTSEEYQNQSAYMKSQYWNLLVTRYALCELTFSTDKLIALSGIAREVHRVVSSEYLAGLWSKELPYNLMWHVSFLGANRSPEYVAPSWSWASISGSYIMTSSVEEEPDKPLERPLHIPRVQKQSHVVILSHATSLANPQDPFGQVIDGFIKLRSKLGMAEWIYEPGLVVTRLTISVIDALDAPGDPPRVCTGRRLEMNRTLGEGIYTQAAIQIDSVEHETLRKVYYLPLYTSMGLGHASDWKNEIEALLLLRRPCGRYVRVGVARLDADNEEELLGSLLEHEITII
jgi:hypothetical protein